MKRSLLTLARSPLGALIVGVAFERCSKILPVNRVYETDLVLAFRHPKPYWAEHILIVPKKAIKSLQELKPEDQQYLTKSFHVAQKIINQRTHNNAYQLILNGGNRQEVTQLHIHLGFGKTV